MNLKRNLRAFFCISTFFLLCVFSLNAQERSRIVQNVPQNPVNRESQPVNNPNRPAIVVRQTMSAPTSNPAVRPTLTNKIIVVGSGQTSQPLIQNTGSSRPVNAAVNYAAVSSNRLAYSSSLNNMLMNSINTKLGIPYQYGSTGPNRYDCSGFVWSVFQDAGVLFERSSAKTFWNEFDQVEDDARYQFGTLVFFNHLGHVGIVADENGFYQASSSKGITYSPFKGYWEKRIVGFRRIPASYYQQ